MKRKSLAIFLTSVIMIFCLGLMADANEAVTPDGMSKVSWDENKNNNRRALSDDLDWESFISKNNDERKIIDFKRAPTVTVQSSILAKNEATGGGGTTAPAVTTTLRGASYGTPVTPGTNFPTALNIKNRLVRGTFTGQGQYHYYCFDVTSAEEANQKPFGIVLADLPSNCDYDVLFSDGSNVYYDQIRGNGVPENYGYYLGAGRWYVVIYSYTHTGGTGSYALYAGDYYLANGSTLTLYENAYSLPSSIRYFGTWDVNGNFTRGFDIGFGVKCTFNFDLTKVAYKDLPDGAVLDYTMNPTYQFYNISSYSRFSRQPTEDMQSTGAFHAIKRQSDASFNYPFRFFVLGEPYDGLVVPKGTSTIPVRQVWNYWFGTVSTTGQVHYDLEALTFYFIFPAHSNNIDWL